MDIAEFIAARLDEDEAVAKAWRYPEWERRGHAVWMRLGGDFRLAAECPLPMGSEPSPAEHIALHDPDRELREVAAKRAILAMHERARSDLGLEDAVRELAAVWSDHPDYRDEWKP